MRKMYQYASMKLSTELSGVGWEEARAEFISSVPTTWAPILIVESLKQIARKLGFGSHHEYSLTT
jgi:hypothetical protein